jgi:putative methyltransferase (TIGR04325 family)
MYVLNMFRIKEVLRLIPLRAIKRLFQYEYIPEGWPYAENHSAIRGWDVEDVAAVYRLKWQKFVSMAEGSGPLGFSHESDLMSDTDLYSHNVIMSFGYVLCLASRAKKEISILDWGGGIGHYYLLAKALLPGVTIDYHCKDLPKLAALGRELLPCQHFYTDDTCFERKYDLVIASGSFQYSKNWPEILEKLATVTLSHLYIARLPVIQTADSFVFVQRPYLYGYNTEYLGWCLNVKDFLKCADSLKLAVVREFDYGNSAFILNAPEHNRERGYLFTPSL